MVSLNYLARLEHRVYVEKNRVRLKNKNFTIISDNCNGGIILHDLRMQFSTPTVNLYMMPEDYLRFLKNPKKYIQTPPVEMHEDGISFPIGIIKDVKIYFMHYESIEKAAEKWLERGARVNFDNLYVMMTDKNGCTKEQAREFDNLPYKHKVFFTSKKQFDISCAVWMRDFEGQPEVGVLSDWKPGFWKRRYLDDFDYIGFLNER